MLKFKINDKIIVLNGKDKGKIGIIKKVIKKKEKNIIKKFLLIEGINIFKKHIKGNPNKNKTGGILNIEKAIAYSNVMLINKTTEKKDKIKFTYNNDKKFRTFKTNNELLK